MNHNRHLRHLTMLTLFITLITNIAAPLAANAQEHKTVRVGWYESSFNNYDRSGRRSGYAYEYQLKLSAYNGWSYEYVTGSWSELMQKLKTGEIDLMSDVSHTREREEYMYFSELPMGSEQYYLFTAPGNNSISPTDNSTLNGKRVSVNKDSFQRDLFVEWAEHNNINVNLTEVSCTESESIRMLQAGETDAYVTVDSFMDPLQTIPTYKIGSSEYYFAVTKGRPDLLRELNMAMGRIQDENRFYNIQMYEKHMRNLGANAVLSAQETEWLSKHGKIRVGYQDNYMAFCAKDESTGQLTGVLKDYLELVSGCMSNTHLEFETTAYPTAADAMKALESGAVDCVFPANLSPYDAETNNIVMSPAMMNTEVHAVVRVNDPNIFAKGDSVTVAVNEGNLNYEAFLAEHYPSWKRFYSKSTVQGLKAVAEGKADCLMISNFRYNNISRLCKNYHLTTFSIGVEIDYCFAVRKGDTDLYSILSKSAGEVPKSSVNAALAYYITEEAKLGVMDYIVDNMPVVLLIAAIILIIFLVLLVQTMRTAKKAKKLILATETDDLTGLYNRKYFFQYADRMYHEHRNRPMDAIVVNIDQFHSVNALHGREFGDMVLQTLGDEINSIAKEYNGIGGRFEADRFDIYCSHTEDYNKIYDRIQTRMDNIVPSANLRLRMGVMPWSKDMEPVQLFDRARTACNMSRGPYREQLQIYDEKVSAQESYEQRLVNDLKHALEARDFKVYYQPKFKIQSDAPQLAGAEALVRWKHPELGMIPPADFIPLLERNGQIRLLDKYVWTDTAKQIAEWREKYGVMIPISVNLSRVDVFDPELENILDDILKNNSLDHKAFQLEVTESAYTEDSDHLIRVIENLHKKGYDVEMDDFGTGYSSLNMLSSMPIDVLKMDREFVRNISYNEKDVQMVALILDIAKTLKVPVIAEGVETEDQLRMLKKFGCEMVQGFYFSRPLPADEFEKAFIKDNKTE